MCVAEIPEHNSLTDSGEEAGVYRRIYYSGDTFLHDTAIFKPGLLFGLIPGETGTRL